MAGKPGAINNAKKQCGKRSDDLPSCRCCIVNINHTVTRDGRSFWGGYGSVVKVPCSKARATGMTPPPSIGMPTTSALNIHDAKLDKGGSEETNELQYYDW